MPRKDPASRAAYWRAYQAEHRAALREYERARYTDPELRERRRAQGEARRRAAGILPRRQGRTRTGAEAAEYNAAYYADAEHRERITAQASERSAWQRFGAAEIERIDWRVYRDLRAQPCIACGRTPSRGVDHLVPLRMGGRHIPENLIPMDRACNSRKAHREKYAALRMLG